MEVAKMFLVNTSILVTVSYLANLIYKYALHTAPAKLKYMLSVILVIFCGWLSMQFGYRLNELTFFDLRFLPLIISTVMYKHPLTLIIIGFGIGLSRLTLGISEQAFVALGNLTSLGVAAAILNVWMRHKGYSVFKQGVITILVLNALNTFNIAVFGVIPFRTYMLEIVPITLPVGIVLCFLFSVILRDFQLERSSVIQIEENNIQLSKQAEELKQAKEVLEDRANQLALASQYKSDFLANISHELRTPLNSIINFAQMLEEKDGERTPEETAMYASMIEKSGSDLLKLINDILDMSKVEAGQLEISEEEMSLYEIPELMQMNFQSVADKKGVAFDIILNEDLPDKICTDPQRLQQILLNLLSNSFKFTTEGQVTLRIQETNRIEEQNMEGEWISFSVSDTGIGISPDKHQLIFEAFQQASGSISRHYGGTGLGLSISRDLARLLGGFITLQSQEGEGSTFTLYLPKKFD